MDLKRNNKTVRYLTNIGNKSPHIPYYGQRFRPWNVFKLFCAIPFLRSDLCDGRSAVISLEHTRTDITQHLLMAVCDQTAAHANAPPHHLANTDCQNRVAVMRIKARQCIFFISEWRGIMILQHEKANLQVFVFTFVLSFVCSMIKYKTACNVTTFVSIIHANYRKKLWQYKNWGCLYNFCIAFRKILCSLWTTRLSGGYYWQLWPIPSEILRRMKTNLHTRCL